MKRRYANLSLPAFHLAIIEKANMVLRERAREGFGSMTLREIYYQFIAHDLFPDDRRFAWENNKWVRYKDGSNPNATKNAQPNYKWLLEILKNGRLAGLIDWDSMADNVRSASLRGGGYHSPAEYASGIGSDYFRNTRDAQDAWIEVWVEKDAQIGVVDRVVGQWDVSSFACRGNVSSSAIYLAAKRMAGKIEEGKRVVILHLGDHDPNGIDMSRDNEDRLRQMILVNLGVDPGDVDDVLALDDPGPDEWAFLWEDVTSLAEPFLFRRIGLNMDQIRTFNPPPSPAKITDSRSASYIERFGQDSWELDALSPTAMREIIERNVMEFFDLDAYNEIQAQERVERAALMSIADRWDEIETFLTNNPEGD